MKTPCLEKPPSPAKAVRLKNGRMEFSSQSLRRLLFWLTLFMLVMGAGYKLGILV